MQLRPGSPGRLLRGRACSLDDPDVLAALDKIRMGQHPSKALHHLARRLKARRPGPDEIRAVALNFHQAAGLDGDADQTCHELRQMVRDVRTPHGGELALVADIARRIAPGGAGLSGPSPYATVGRLMLGAEVFHVRIHKREDFAMGCRQVEDATAVPYRTAAYNLRILEGDGLIRVTRRGKSGKVEDRAVGRYRWSGPIPDDAEDVALDYLQERQNEAARQARDTP